MTKLDEEVERLARRLAVARLALAQGGPAELLLVILAPVMDSIERVNNLAMHDGQATFDPVDQPIGPATTRVLADMVSPVPAALAHDPTYVDMGHLERGTRERPVTEPVRRPWEFYDHIHDSRGLCVKNRWDGIEDCRATSTPILPRDAVIGDNGEIITADGVTGRTLVHGCGHSHAPGTECPDADA